MKSPYGFIVKQKPASFQDVGMALLSDGSLTVVSPKFPRFPSLTTVTYWDFYSYLCNNPTLSLSIEGRPYKPNRVQTKIRSQHTMEK